MSFNEDIKTYFENGSKDDYRFVMAVYERYCFDKQRVMEAIDMVDDAMAENDEKSLILNALRRELNFDGDE
jgi:hypothetical protein